MKISNEPIYSLLGGDIQYVLPIYHRSFVWTEKEISDFFKDIYKTLHSDSSAAYFIGNIVRKELIGKDIQTFLVIDGQQRLITTILLFAAIQLIFTKNNLSQDKEYKKIARYFVNSLYEDEEGEEKEKFYKFRFHFTKTSEQETFNAIIDTCFLKKEANLNAALKSLNNINENNILNCFFYLIKAIENKISENKLNIKSLFSLLIGKKICVADIKLDDKKDNPNLIFESLNASGIQLSPIDLIRNSFFTTIPLDEQKKYYETYWSPIEETFFDAKTRHKEFMDFIRIYLSKDGEPINDRDFYLTLTDKMQGNPIEALKKISKYHGYYSILINPKKEPNERIAAALQRLAEIPRLNAKTLLLECYADYKENRLQAEELCKIISIIENFAIRISLCGRKKVNTKVFCFFYRETKKLETQENNSFVDNLKEVLLKHGYPNNNEVKKRFLRAQLDPAHGLEPKSAFFILREIEKSFAHKEQINFQNMEIGYFLPKKNKLSDEWKKYIGEKWAEFYDVYHLTFVNLVIVPKELEFNIRNTSFQQAQALLKNSKLELNKQFANLTAWNAENIRERSETLYQKFIEVWKFFGKENNADKEENLDKKLSKLIFDNKTFDIKSWKDVLQYTVEHILNIHPEHATAIVKLSSYLTDDPKKFDSPIRIKENVFMQFDLRQGQRLEEICQKILKKLKINMKWEIIYA